MCQGCIQEPVTVFSLTLDARVRLERNWHGNLINVQILSMVPAACLMLNVQLELFLFHQAPYLADKLLVINYSNSWQCLPQCFSQAPNCTKYCLPNFGASLWARAWWGVFPRNKEELEDWEASSSTQQRFLCRQGWRRSCCFHHVRQESVPDSQGVMELCFMPLQQNESERDPTRLLSPYLQPTDGCVWEGPLAVTSVRQTPFSSSHQIPELHAFALNLSIQQQPFLCWSLHEMWKQRKDVPLDFGAAALCDGSQIATVLGEPSLKGRVSVWNWDLWFRSFFNLSQGRLMATNFETVYNEF